MADLKSIMEATEAVALSSVKQYPKNPRIGNVEAIAESLQENGQFQPIVVQKSTRYILSGNHTAKAALSLGWKRIDAVIVDVTDEAAARIVLAANRTNDLASYNTQILQDILSGLPDAKGTGYDDEAVSKLLDGIKTRDTDMVDEVLMRPPSISINSPDIGPEGDNAIYTNPVTGEYEAGEVRVTGIDAPGQSKVTDDDDIDTLDDQLGELQGMLQLKQDMQFPGANYYQIPDLATSHLVQELPDLIDTWGGHDATPDDGQTTWVWNYGVASRKNLPTDRAILCFYTYDYNFESFWTQPAFMVAKMLNAGIKTAVVPDFSYYTDEPVAQWVMNQFRAQWVGRYFQEAGINVIPRIQYAIDKRDSASLDFNTMGIPKGSPVVAKCSQNMSNKDEFDLDAYGLRKSLEKIEPKTLLIYGGNPALRLIEAVDPVKNGLCEKVVHIYNYAHKRRGVVFDKKEGLAGYNKEQKRKALDKASMSMTGVVIEDAGE